MKRRTRSSLSSGSSKYRTMGVVALAVVAAFFVAFFSYVQASDGSGTAVVVPATATAGSVGNTHTLTFTATETMDSGEVAVIVPNTWSAPQGTPGVAGYTTVSSTDGVVADVLNTLDTATDWTAMRHMVLSVDAMDKQEGSAALVNTIGSTAAANEQWYVNNGTSANWGTTVLGNMRVGMWLKSTVATAAGDLSWQDDDSSDLVSPLDTVSLPALSADAWTYTSVSLAAATRAAVQSYGFRYTNDIGPVAVKTDSLSTIFSANDVMTGWSRDANITVSALTTPGNYVEGTGAVRCAYSAKAGAGATGDCFDNEGSIISLGSGTVVTFWMRSSVALDAGDFAFVTDDSSNLASPEDIVNLPAIPANTWTYLKVLAPNSADARSFGVRQMVDKGVVNIDLDAFGKQIDATDSLSGWTAPTSIVQTLATDASIVHEGTASLRNTITSTAAVGDAWYHVLSTPQDWSTKTTIGFWMRSTVAVAAGQWKFAYSAASDLSSPIDSLDLAAMAANTWTYQTFTLSGSRSSVQSFGVIYATDLGAATVHIDDLLIGPGLPTFPGDRSIHVRLVKLAPAQTVAITYGSGGGVNGTTAPTLAGVSTFATQSRPTDSGMLQDIASSPTITVTPAATQNFTLNDPGDMTAGTRVGYTIVRKDAYGNLVSAGAQTVYLYSTSTGNKAFYTAPSGGSPVASLAIADGSSEAMVWYEDDKAGVYTITMSDNAVAPDGPTGIVDATDTITVTAGPISQFTLNDPGDMIAGTRLAYTVTRRDVFGNAVSVGVTTAYLYSNSTGNDAFYDASSGGNRIQSAFIGDGNSSATFWYEDDKAGSPVIIVSDNATSPDGATGIADAADGVVVSASVTSQLSLSDPGGMAAGTRLGYTVTRKDAYGNLVVSGTDTVYLYSNSTGNNAFYDAASGGNLITQVDILNGNADATFWYEDDKAGTVTVTTSDHPTAPDGATGIDDASDVITVSAAEVARFTINDPGNLVAGSRLAYTITRTDVFGNPVLSGASTVYLYSDSVGEKAFYPVASGGSAITSTSITEGNASVNVWYEDHTVGAAVVTASDHAVSPDGEAGIDDASDSVSITAGATARYILNDPGDTAVGTRIGYTVSREDAFGNLVTAGEDLVYLYSDSTGSSAFYRAASGGDQISFLQISEGNASAAFWYADDQTGVKTITASDHTPNPDGTDGIIDAADALTVSAGAVSQFTLNNPGDMTAGTRLGYTVGREDAFGNSVTSGSSTIYLYSSSAGNKAFYLSSSGGGPVTSAEIMDGSASVAIWYEDDAAGSITVTASDNASAPDGATGIDDVSDVVEIRAGATSRFLLNDPGDMVAGTRLGYTVTRQDAFGNLVTEGSEVVYLHTNSSGNKAFYTTASGGSAIDSIMISDGSSSAEFWYEDDLAGSVVVVASDHSGLPDGATGIDDAADDVTIRAAATSVYVLNHPGSTSAGVRAAYVVVREDAFGNVVTEGQEEIALYSDAPSGAFYSVASGGIPIGVATVLDGESSAAFWYEDTHAGLVTITVSDHAGAPDGDVGIDDAVDTLVVSAGETARFVLTDHGEVVIGSRVAYTVSREDVFGNSVTAGTTVVYLYSSSAGTSAFFDTAIDGSSITSISITEGNTSASFWYEDAALGAVTVTASDNATAPDGEVGIDDATDTITLTVGDPDRFVLVDPTDDEVGASVTVTVWVEDRFGNLITNYQGDVTLRVSGSATGAGLIDVVNGVGTKVVSDLVVETIQLTLDDTEGTGLNVSTEQDLTFRTGPTRQLFLNDPGSLVAGTRVGYVVTRQDAFGNLVTSGIDTLYLYSNSSGNGVFYDVAEGGAPVSSVSIGSGSSTATFWYEDDKVGDFTVTVSDNAFVPDGEVEVDDATDSLTVLSAAPSQFLLNDPGDIQAGVRIGYTVSREDAFGNAVLSGETMVYLSSDSLGNSAFYDSVSGGAELASVRIVDGESAAAFWYVNDTTGSATITVSDSSSGPNGTDGINDDSDSLTVLPGPTSIFLLDDPGDMNVGTRVGYTVTRKDAFGNLVTSGVDTIYVYSNSLGSSAGFYDAAVDGNKIASLQMADNQSSAVFWYTDDVAGNVNIVVSDNASAPDAEAGIIDDQDLLTITEIPIIATRFVLIDPTDAVVGSEVTVTVKVTDNFGSVDTTFQGGVALELSGSATGGGLMEIVNGVGSLTITNTLAETVELSLVDALGTGLDSSARENVVFSAGPVAALVLNDPGDTVAGTRLAYTATRQDQFGNAVTTGSTTIYLYAGADGSMAFYDQAASGSVITFVSFENGSATAAFWYEKHQVGSDTIVVSDHAEAPDGAAGVLDASDEVFVAAGSTFRFTLTDPGDMSVNTRLGYTIAREDGFGNSVTVGEQTVYLYATSDGTAVFYDAPIEGNQVSAVTIADGESTAQVWYFEGAAGTWVVTASENAGRPNGDAGIVDATDTLFVSEQAITATQILFSVPASAYVDEPVTVMVRAADAQGNTDTAFAGTVTLLLSGSATGGGVVQIENGIGTREIITNEAETVQLSLSDTGETGLDVSSVWNITFSSAPSGGGGGGVGQPEAPAPVAPTILRFEGRAYPGARATLRARDLAGTTLLVQTIVSQADGSFQLEYTGPFANALAYEIGFVDAQGVATSPVSFIPTITPSQTTTLSVFAPPTIRAERLSVLRGTPFLFSGTASPGSTVEAVVDEGRITQTASTADDGTYTMQIDSLALDFGEHRLTIRQVAADGTVSPEGRMQTLVSSSTINPKTDLNNDGVVDIVDWSIFLVQWQSSDVGALAMLDFNGDGRVDVADFSIFVRAIRQ